MFGEQIYDFQRYKELWPNIILLLKLFVITLNKRNNIQNAYFCKHI